MEETRERLILDNMPLATYFAKRYFFAGCERDELISEGMLGLVKAASTFDSRKGYQFSTYAGRCITNQILQYLRRTRKYLWCVSLEERLSNADNAGTYADVIPDDKGWCGDIEDRMTIETLLSRSEQEELLRQYFGIGRAPLTQEEIAEQLGVTQSIVSRKIREAARRLAKEKAPSLAAKGA